MIAIWPHYDEAKAKYDNVIYDMVYGYNYENTMRDIDDGDVVYDDNDILNYDNANLDDLNTGRGRQYQDY